jgi:ABC-type uncharacterized transport system substrate-binding protein
MHGDQNASSFELHSNSTEIINDYFSLSGVFTRIRQIKDFLNRRWLKTFQRCLNFYRGRQNPVFCRSPRSLGAIVSLLAALANGESASAHPHVLVSVQAEIVYAGGKATALRQSWTYDRAYSAFAARGLKTDGNGRLPDNILAGFAKSQIEAFAPYGFFTIIKANGGTLDVAEPRDYRFAQNSDGSLTLNFTLPLRTAMAASNGLVLEIHDPNFFAYFTIADGTEALHLTGAPPGCGADVSGPKPIDLTQLASISSAFWQALRNSEKGLAMSGEFINRIIVTCR